MQMSKILIFPLIIVWVLFVTATLAESADSQKSAVLTTFLHQFKLIITQFKIITTSHLMIPSDVTGLYEYTDKLSSISASLESVLRDEKPALISLIRTVDSFDELHELRTVMEFVQSRFRAENEGKLQKIQRSHLTSLFADLARAVAQQSTKLKNI